MSEIKERPQVLSWGTILGMVGLAFSAFSAYSSFDGRVSKLEYDMSRLLDILCEDQQHHQKRACK